MRKRPTQSENLLWEELRNSKLGCKFKRQYSLENYVVDFFCKERKFAIEIEGRIHNKKDVSKYDEYRFRYLEALGVKVIRVRSDEVEEQMGMVLDRIKDELDKPLLLK